MKSNIDILKKGSSKLKLLVKSWDPFGLYSAPLSPLFVPISNLLQCTNNSKAQHLSILDNNGLDSIAEVESEVSKALGDLKVTWSTSTVKLNNH